jgi:hypothetical protein
MGRRPREPDMHYVKTAEAHRSWNAAHEARLESAWQRANEAVMAAGRASSAAWAAIAARRADAKAVGDAIASEMFAMHGPRRG